MNTEIIKKGSTVIAVIAAILILTFIVPTDSSYAATPYFTAANNTLLPFRESTMPFFSDGVLYVPYNIFSEFGINSISSTELGMVHLYKGNKFVDFYESDNTSIDQDGRVREGVSARRQNGIFFLPLGVVGSYFDLQYEIIAYEPISIIRVKSGDTASSAGLLSEKNFISIYKKSMQASAVEYFAEPIQTQAPPATDTPTTPPVVVTPVYDSVTVYLSFYNISPVLTVKILDALAAPGYRACFFVSAGDIIQDPGLIRRILGNGHTLGINLAEGGIDEYLHASNLLYEAAKVKTVLITSNTAKEQARLTAEENNLILHGASIDFPENRTITANAVTDNLPTANWEKYNLMLDISNDTVTALPVVLAHLRKHEYSVVKITETVAPVIAENE